MKQNNKKLAKVYHYDLYGKRDEKYKFLDEKSVNNIEWNELEYKEPYYFFVPKDFEDEESYKEGVKIESLMINVSGIETKRDHFAIDFDKQKLIERINDFVENDYSPEIRKSKFKLRDNEWVVEDAVIELRKSNDLYNNFVKCITRPFDIRWIIYNNIILSRDRGVRMKGMNKKNFGLVLGRQSKEDFGTLITNCVCTHKIVTVYDRSFIFPLYLYPEAGEQATLDQSGGATTPSFGHPSKGGECREGLVLI